MLEMFQCGNQHMALNNLPSNRRWDRRRGVGGTQGRTELVSRSGSANCKLQGCADSKFLGSSFHSNETRLLTATSGDLQT